MKKKVFRKRYEIVVHEKLEKPKAEVVIVEEPNIKEEVVIGKPNTEEYKEAKPRRSRIWK